MAVEVSERDGVAIVELARPPVNAIEIGLATEMLAAVERVEAAPGVRAVVITGWGTCFSAGVDVKAVPRYRRPEQRALVGTINRTVRRVYGLPKPVVAAVNGHALGGGLVVALACDLRVATTRDCRLGLTEVTAGIPFPAGPMVVVRAELAPAAARVLTLTGRVLGPAEAAAMGVVDELQAPEALLARACALAASLAAASVFAVVKRQLRAEALAALTRIVEHDEDPLLTHWLEPREV